MEIHLIFGLICIGFIAGYIDTIAGGGGMLTLPAYLLAGLPPHLALGTNKLSATLSVGNAARIFIKKRVFKPAYWQAAIVASLAGAALGALLVHFLSAEFLYKALPVIFLLLIVYMLLPKRPLGMRKDFRAPPISSSLMGFSIGCYDGFVGPGTGSFWAIGLMAFYKLDLVEATGVAKLMNFLSNVMALMVFMAFGSVHYGVALVMGAAMMSGAYLGAHSVIKFGFGFVRAAFLIIATLMAGCLAYQHW